jgi:hypothetical protein
MLQVVPKLHKIAVVAAAAALRPLDDVAAVSAQRRLVDVGTGTGCLIPHYLEVSATAHTYSTTVCTRLVVAYGSAHVSPWLTWQSYIQHN